MNQDQQAPGLQQASRQAGNAMAKNPSRMDTLKARLEHAASRAHEAAESAHGINSRLNGAHPPDMEGGPAVFPTVVGTQEREAPDGFCAIMERDFDSLERGLELLENTLKETHGLL